MDVTAVIRNLDNAVLEVVRKVYGMEREFWNAIHGVENNKILEERFYNRIVRKIKEKLAEEFPAIELNQ